MSLIESTTLNYQSICFLVTVFMLEDIIMGRRVGSMGLESLSLSRAKYKNYNKGYALSEENTRKIGAFKDNDVRRKLLQIDTSSSLSRFLCVEEV